MKRDTSNTEQSSFSFRRMDWEDDAEMETKKKKPIWTFDDNPPKKMSWDNYVKALRLEGKKSE